MIHVRLYSLGLHLAPSLRRGPGWDHGSAQALDSKVILQVGLCCVAVRGAKLVCRWGLCVVDGRAKCLGHDTPLSMRVHQRKRGIP